MAKYSFSQLQDLWKSVGGSAPAAVMAAAIAMAESGGNSSAVNHNSNGTTDRGLWQINSIHGSLSTFDPVANARAAVQISNNGSTWRPWCTAWSSGKCSGTYLGSGAPYQKFMPSGSQSTGSSSTGTTGSSTGSSPADVTPTGLGLGVLDPATWAQAFLGPIGVWLWNGLLTFVGVAMMSYGILILIKERTRVGQIVPMVRSAAASYATRGVYRGQAAAAQPKSNASPSQPRTVRGHKVIEGSAREVRAVEAG